jgi:hypothetical protein
MILGSGFAAFSLNTSADNRRYLTSSGARASDPFAVAGEINTGGERDAMTGGTGKQERETLRARERKGGKKRNPGYRLFGKLRASL